MYYCDYFRSEDLQGFDNLNSMYETKPIDFPFCCPYYRQFFFTSSMDFMNRQPGGGPPFSPPPGQQSSEQSIPPAGPPPSITPSKQSPMVHSAHDVYAVDPNSLKPCLLRYVYIWPRRGNPFWAWLTYIGMRSASGFRWTGRNWVYFGIDLTEIDSFICY
ncbi:hypothetical protein [Clostridium magnum]|uniref:Transporter n=1 Tax=Clostridium magnum DSM 2767 TaxID=1121326 RepID=A0A161XE65_9CLOT|nr:hypothetical protein [Clostridium magnum]KZL92666.1 hypothetical protein CLMAG_24800 [Clostridium magnum DSM 2767]SHI24302.1 hypothetical protein SAMN02745944_03535 [Clostridium magnum DSM 2767]